MGCYILQLGFYPLFYVVFHDGLLERLRAASAFVVGHIEGFVYLIGLLVYIEGVNGESVLAEFLIGASILGEDEDAIPLIDDSSFFGHSVHAVADGVHKEDVVVFVGSDRAREV